jgi:hypothetical protein
MASSFSLRDRPKYGRLERGRGTVDEKCYTPRRVRVGPANEHKRVAHLSPKAHGHVADLGHGLVGRVHRNDGMRLVGQNENVERAEGLRRALDSLRVPQSRKEICNQQQQWTCVSSCSSATGTRLRERPQRNPFQRAIRAQPERAEKQSRRQDRRIYSQGHRTFIEKTLKLTLNIGALRPHTGSQACKGGTQ